MLSEGVSHPTQRVSKSRLAKENKRSGANGYVMRLPSFGAAEKWSGRNLSCLIGANVVFSKGIGSSTTVMSSTFLSPLLGVGSSTLCCCGTSSTSSSPLLGVSPHVTVTKRSGDRSWPSLILPFVCYFLKPSCGSSDAYLL